MNKNFFIFYESDIDSELLSKYFGNNISAGIYAIPEDSISNSNDDSNLSDEMRKYTDPESGGKNLNAFQKKSIEQDQLDQNIRNLPQSEDLLSKLPPEELQKFNYEIIPLKKMYLFNKLNSLSTKLKNNFKMNTDLELLLKFGTSLSYETMLILALNILNKIKQESSQDNNSSEEIEDTNVEK